MNIMQPGFGVGGYCLTKDPLFAEIAAAELFGLDDMKFPFCTLAVKTNNKMPLVSLDAIAKYLGGVHGKRILVLGVSYRQDIADTRYSATEIFVKAAECRGAIIRCHDPFVKYWAEMDRKLPDEIPSPIGFDCVVFTVQHRQYLELDLTSWLQNATPYVFDANRVLTAEQMNALNNLNIRYRSIGRG
jgi:UDP-N-acetyl-D-mannosaminuronate dehydrogenase